MLALDSPRRPGLDAVRAAAPPTRRAMEWTPAVFAAVLALAVVAHRTILAVQRDHDLPLPWMRLAMVVLAAGAAFTFDDPAECTLASAPVPRWQRRTIRLGLATAAWLSAWAVVLAVASAAPGALAVAPLTLEALGWLSVALAVAAVSDSTATVPAMLVSYVGAHRLPHRLALITEHQGPAWDAARDRWLALIAVAVVVVAASNCDPARRRLHRHRHAPDTGAPA